MYDPREGGYKNEDFLNFISSNNVAALAVTSDKWDVQVTTVFYAVEFPFSLLIKSHTTSNHGLVIAKGANVALAIFDPLSSYSTKSGVQLRGVCERITDSGEMKNAVQIYSHTFDGAADRFAPVEELVSSNAKSTLFRIKIISGKMLTPDGYSKDFQEF